MKPRAHHLPLSYPGKGYCRRMRMTALRYVQEYVVWKTLKPSL